MSSADVAWSDVAITACRTTETDASPTVVANAVNASHTNGVVHRRITLELCPDTPASLVKARLSPPCANLCDEDPGLQPPGWTSFARLRAYGVTHGEPAAH